MMREIAGRPASVAGRSCIDWAAGAVMTGASWRRGAVGGKRGGVRIFGTVLVAGSGAAHPLRGLLRRYDGGDGARLSGRA